MNSMVRGSVVVMVILGLLVVGSAKDCSGASKELAKDQVVVYGIPAADVQTIDPLGVQTIANSPHAYQIFSGLVRYPTGDCTSQDFQPDLATSWEVSPDNLTWTFHLRKGVQWHRGYGELTSEDVVYSLNRTAKSKVSTYSYNYENFEDIKAIDRYTVQIATSKPEPFLLNKVANYLGAFIVCKKAVEKAGAFDQLMAPSKEVLIGTGPYMFSEYRPKDGVVLVRNDNYYTGEKYTIEKIVAKFIPDESAREAALLKGDIAVTLGLYDGKWLNYMRSNGLVVEPLMPIDLKALYFDIREKPFSDRRVREAFAYATDQDSLVNMQGKAISRRCTSPVPSGTYGFVDAGWGKYKRDVEKAKKLLAEAGYPDGFTVKIWMSSGFWFYDKMVMFQGQLRDVGIDLEMTKVDDPIYQAKVFAGLNSLVIKGGKYPLPTYWLRQFYHTNSILGKPKGSNNFMYYSNPEVDRFIEVAEVTFDEKERLDALAKAQRIIVEDLPAIPVVETLLPVVRHPWLDLGYELTGNFIGVSEVGPDTKILKH